MIKYLLILAFLASDIFALTPKEILKISAKEHNAKNVQPELALFGKHRKYRLEAKVDIPENVAKSPDILMNAKFVSGKYAVSDFSFDMNGKKINIVSVIVYNSKESCYDQWTLNKQSKEVFHMKGLLLNGTKIVSWVNVDQRSQKGLVVSSLADYEKQVWREVHMQDGSVIFGLSGKCIPIK